MFSILTFPKQIPRTVFTAIVNGFRRHSFSLILFSVLFIYLGKINWYIQMMAAPASPGADPEMGFTAYIADDLLFFSALLTLLWWLEFLIRRRWIQLVTVGIAIPTAIVSVSNLFWLRGTGNQISLSVVNAGLSRGADAIPILKSGLGPEGVALLALSVALLVGLPFLFQKQWRKEHQPDTENPKSTLAIPLLLAIVGFGGIVEQKIHMDFARPGWRLYADNVFILITRELFMARELQSPPVRYPSDRSKRDVADDNMPPKPDILVVFLEAVAHRATSFNPKIPDNTPFLRSLAATGLQATSMRAVLPHTTKTIFSMLCGNYPSMQMEILETADNYAMRCLPEILAQNGYATAFFQSASGQFEDRPRLIHNAGFSHFEGLQNLRPSPQKLGYLAGDDAGLTQPVLNWVNSQKSPYMVTVLTSATHHTYEVPDRMTKGNSPFKDARSWPQSHRYLLLVHEADRVLSTIVEGLKRMGRADNLIIVVSGDHGEAFGEHGGFQHDNIFNEEGLHVPFVVHFPPRIKPGTRVEKNRSLIDVTPTLLDAARISHDASAFDGRSLLQSESHPIRRYFSCWYTDTCVGFVENNHKVVYLPNARSWLVYDLSSDPLELKPRVDDPAWIDGVSDLRRWYDQHRFTTSGLLWNEAALFEGKWQCSAGQNRCRHEKSELQAGK